MRDTGIDPFEIVPPLLADSDMLREQEFEYVHALTCDVADAMLMVEGPWWVDGRYYANAGDAEIQRMLAANKIVRERIRQEKQRLNQSHIPKELRSA